AAAGEAPGGRRSPLAPSLVRWSGGQPPGDQGAAHRLHLLPGGAPRLEHAVVALLAPLPDGGANVLMPFEALGLPSPGQHGGNPPQPLLNTRTRMAAVTRCPGSTKTGAWAESWRRWNGN